jgi:hypothetical protein
MKKKKGNFILIDKSKFLNELKKVKEEQLFLEQYKDLILLS